MHTASYYILSFEEIYWFRKLLVIQRAMPESAIRAVAPCTSIQSDYALQLFKMQAF